MADGFRAPHALNNATITHALVADNASYLVDTIAPSAPTINAIAGDDTVNASEQSAVISGTNEAGATVSLSLGAQTRAATVVGTNWSYTITDTAGNNATLTHALVADNASYLVDTTPPAAPTFNNVAGDNIINASEQNSVIGGTFVTGATVNLSLGGQARTVNVSGTNWSYTLTAADITNMGQGPETITVRQTDLAGNTSSAATRSVTVDTVLPTATITDNVSGTANGPVTFTFTFSEAVVGFTASDVTVSAGTQGTFTTVSTSQYTLVVTPPSGSGNMNVGVTLGSFTDSASNVNAVAPTTNIQAYKPAAAGDAVISMGSWGGQLIHPIQVEGRWYYVWDRNGDGVQNTSPINGVLDYTAMDVLETLFYGSSTGTVITESNRQATVNGVNIRLPTDGQSSLVTGSVPGTAVNSPTQTNATYDDLLAIWDAYNGNGTGTGTSAVLPSGWAGGSTWSATPSSLGHVFVSLTTGGVVDYLDSGGNYVVFQVL